MASPIYPRFKRSDWDRVQAFLLAEGQPTEHAKSVLAHEEVVGWLAIEDDKVVGWVLTHPSRSNDGAERGFVEDLVIAGDRRGRGIGRRLMELAESHYRESGVVGMQLTVRADNEPALRLYESLGYATVQLRLRMRKQFS